MGRLECCCKDDCGRRFWIKSFHRFCVFQDNSVSLLQYVVAQYVRKYDPDAGTDRTQLPIPEPSDINQASLVNFEDLEQELKKAQTSLESKQKAFVCSSVQ